MFSKFKPGDILLYTCGCEQLSMFISYTDNFQTAIAINLNNNSKKWYSTKDLIRINNIMGKFLNVK